MNRFIKALIAGTVIFIASSAVRGVFSADDTTKVFSALCDGSFITAIILICSGLLVFTEKSGLYDGATYAGHLFAAKHWKKNAKPSESFADYREKKNEKRKSRKFFNIIVVGLGFLAVSAIFLMLYMKV